MVSVSEASQKTLDRASVLLAGVPDGMQKAIKSAMVRAVQYTNTHYTDYVREEYAVSAGNVKSNTSVSVSYKAGDGVQAEVKYRGTKIPLYKFDGASPKSPQWDWSRTTPIKLSNGEWRTFHPGKPASGHQLTSTGPQKFTGAFVATMPSGHTGIFERDGDSLSEIMGSSGPQMVGRDEVSERIAEAAAEKLDERIAHEVQRLLGF